jgi:xanthine dehydrogenase accessory factor
VAVWDLVERGQELRRQRRAFALATVVRCERPTSAHPGDQALITDDGHLTGWIGGSCAEPVVVREALRAIQTERSCLVRLGPPDVRPAVAPDGVVVYPMTCHSGGTLEVFVDPCLPRPQAVLVGDAPVIETLAVLADAAGFAVARDLNAATLDARTYVVVATHGEADDEALADALRSPAGYVALVASRRRAEACRETLMAEGLTRKEVARLKAPAGLDLGATTPAQIAVSIVAEMVQHACATAPMAREEALSPISAPMAVVDPVCGMTVEPTVGTPSLVHEGTTYYFCCAGCRRQFARDPGRFLASGGGL